MPVILYFPFIHGSYRRKMICWQKSRLATIPGFVFAGTVDGSRDVTVELGIADSEPGR